MLARAELQREFRAWNDRYKAPFGGKLWQKVIDSNTFIGRLLWRNRMRLPALAIRMIGPFGFQKNSRTREFEYPWSYSATPLTPRMRVVEIGGGLSGFQFVLAGQGIDVTTVDPIQTDKDLDWVFSAADFDHFNHSFRTTVKFINTTLQEAHLQADTYDRVFSISVLEHIPAHEISALMKEIYRILCPGGHFVATIDLFLDCFPFSEAKSNRWGTNISVAGLIQESGLKLVNGERSQLYGFEEFRPEIITRKLNELSCVNNVLTQCIVLEKK